LARAIAAKLNIVESILEIAIDPKPPSRRYFFSTEAVVAFLNQCADLGVVGFDKSAGENLRRPTERRSRQRRGPALGP
jgi:hypothetical protein